MKPPCSVPECDRKRESANGFCNGHYRRWRDKGDPGRPFPPRLSVEQRFWSKVARRSVLECWEWQGTTDSYGYGVQKISGRMHKAHRLAYEWLRGPIPAGLTIDHLCWNVLCSNPWHMEPVTSPENTRRRNARRTHCKRGHALTAPNIRLVQSPAGSVVRVCLVCTRLYDEHRIRVAGKSRRVPVAEWAVAS